MTPAFEARAATSVRPPLEAVGVDTVALELFYPGYKGGTAPKGQYRPVSAVLTFRLEAGKPPRLSLVPARKPSGKRFDSDLAKHFIGRRRVAISRPVASPARSVSPPL